MMDHLPKPSKGRWRIALLAGVAGLGLWGAQNPAAADDEILQEISRLETLLDTPCTPVVRTMDDLVARAGDYQKASQAYLGAWQGARKEFLADLGQFLPAGEAVDGIPKPAGALRARYDAILSEAKKTGILATEKVNNADREAIAAAFGALQRGGGSGLYYLDDAAGSKTTTKAQLLKRYQEIQKDWNEAAAAFNGEWTADKFAEVQKTVTSEQRAADLAYRGYNDARSTLSDQYASGNYEHCLGPSVSGVQSDYTISGPDGVGEFDLKPLEETRQGQGLESLPGMGFNLIAPAKLPGFDVVEAPNAPPTPNFKLDATRQLELTIQFQRSERDRLQAENGGLATKIVRTADAVSDGVVGGVVAVTTLLETGAQLGTDFVGAVGGTILFDEDPVATASNAMDKVIDVGSYLASSEGRGVIGAAVSDALGGLLNTVINEAGKIKDGLGTLTQSTDQFEMQPGETIVDEYLRLQGHVEFLTTQNEGLTSAYNGIEVLVQEVIAEALLGVGAQSTGLLKLSDDALAAFRNAVNAPGDALGEALVKSGNNKELRALYDGMVAKRKIANAQEAVSNFRLLQSKADAVETAFRAGDIDADEAASFFGSLKSLDAENARYLDDLTKNMTPDELAQFESSLPPGIDLDDVVDGDSVDLDDGVLDEILGNKSNADGPTGGSQNAAGGTPADGNGGVPGRSVSDDPRPAAILDGSYPPGFGKAIPSLNAQKAAGLEVDGGIARYLGSADVDQLAGLPPGAQKIIGETRAVVPVQRLDAAGNPIVDVSGNPVIDVELPIFDKDSGTYLGNLPLDQDFVAGGGTAKVVKLDTDKLGGALDIPEGQGVVARITGGDKDKGNLYKSDSFGGKVLSEPPLSESSVLSRAKRYGEVADAYGQRKIEFVEEIPSFDKGTSLDNIEYAFARDIIENSAERNLSPGMLRAYAQAKKEIEAAGLVWLDDQIDNFAFRRKSPGSDDWEIIIPDDGGFHPVRLAESDFTKFQNDAGLNPASFARAMDEIAPDVGGGEFAGLDLDDQSAAFSRLTSEQRRLVTERAGGNPSQADSLYQESIESTAARIHSDTAEFFDKPASDDLFQQDSDQRLLDYALSGTELELLDLKNPDLNLSGNSIAVLAPTNRRINASKVAQLDADGNLDQYAFKELSGIEDAESGLAGLAGESPGGISEAADGLGIPGDEPAAANGLSGNSDLADAGDDFADEGDDLFEDLLGDDRSELDICIDAVNKVAGGLSKEEVKAALPSAINCDAYFL